MRNDQTWSVAFSPNGRLLVSAGDYETRMWDVRTHRQVGNPIGCSFPIAFGRDGRLACPPYSSNGINSWTFQFWNPGRDRKVLATIRGPGDGGTAIALSPDGRVLALSYGYDQLVRLWDTRTDRQIGKPLLAYTENNPSLAFSPNGRILATYGT
jgi:WD40 repeat protein